MGQDQKLIGGVSAKPMSWRDSGLRLAVASGESFDLHEVS